MPGSFLRIPLLVAAALPLLTPGAAPAEFLNLTRWGGAVELGTEIASQRTDTPTGGGHLNRYRFDEVLELEVDGYLLTRTLADFHIRGRIGLRQELFNGTPGSGSIFTTLPGYDATLSIFSTKPTSLFFFANRFDNDLIQSFGTDTESRSEAMGAILRLGNRWFPSTLTAQQLASDSSSRGATVVSRRRETRRLVEYDGQHLTEATNISLKLRAVDIDDKSIPAVGDYRTYLGTFLASHRWGPYFERFWRAGGTHFRREGSFQFGSTSANTAFYWDPTETLQTRLEYDFNDFDSNGQRTRNHAATAAFNHRLYESLRSNLNLLFNRQDQNSGNRTTAGPTFLVNYRKQLPWQSQLLVDVGANYRIEDRDVTSTEVSVIGEALLIENLTGNFLENLRIDTSTIEVFESPGGVLLIEEIDYTIDVVGERTSINPIPTGVINLGDVVSVNYAYEGNPSGRISRTGFRFGAGWDAGWISLGYKHDQSDERLLSGADQSLQHSRRDTIRLDLHGDWGRALNGSLAFLLGREKTRSVDFDEVAFQQNLAWEPRRRLHLTAHLRESYRNFRSPSRNELTVTGGLSAFWQIRHGWTMRAFGDIRYVDNSATPKQTDVGLGGRATLRVGKIDVIPTLVWWRRERGQSLTNDVRAILRLRRDF
jgi:hypothetical protein